MHLRLPVGLLTVIVALGADWPPPEPEYTQKREAGLAKMCVETGRDTLCGLLHLASDDPKRIALAEKMILHRIKIGRIVAFFQQDMTLAYRLYRDKLTPEGREKLAEWVRKEIKPGSREHGMRFVHANDNWPFVGMQMLILGGESVGMKEVAAMATDRLEAYLDISRSLGLASEYNSPTYNPMSLVAVDSIAALSESLRTRVVARVIAERLYSEIALRFHAPSSQFGSPHSRAYMHDTMCIGSALKYSLHPLLPGGVLLDRESFPDIGPHLQSVAEETLLRRFFGPHLAAVCETKPYPYLVQARQYRPYRQEGPDTWPAGISDTVTYMTERYVVGTAQRTYGGGAGGTVFQAHWTKRAPRAVQPGDMHTMYLRYRLNDELPPTKSSGVMTAAGYINPLQHRNTTIVLYRPRLGSNGKMTSLCASALVPRGEQLDTVYVGYPMKKVTRLPLSRKEPATVFIKDGDVYLALVPLAVTDAKRIEALRIEHAAKHLIVSLYNLQAKQAQTWSADVFAGTRNGFVIEVGDAKEYGSFEKFARIVGMAKVADTLEDGIRTVSYSREGRSMLVKVDVEAQRYLAREYDGKEYVGPMLRSPHQVASMEAELKLGDAMLTAAPGDPKFLTVEPTTGRYVVTYPFRFPTPLKLTTPGGRITCDGFRMGRVQYKPGTPALVVIDCASTPSPLRFTKPAGPYRVILNDTDVTSLAKPVGAMLEVALPDNTRKPFRPTTLKLDVTPRFDTFTGPKHRGGLICKVTNTGQRAARNICAAVYFTGFGRPYGRHDSERIARLAPGETKQVSWGLTGTPQGIRLRARVFAVADNAPTAVLDVPAGR